MTHDFYVSNSEEENSSNLTFLSVKLLTHSVFPNTILHTRFPRRSKKKRVPLFTYSYPGLPLQVYP